MLELKNISFSAKTDRGNAEILKHVSLTIPDGKFLVITGPNGGGKSTLAKIIMGIEQPTEGSIFLDGENITGLSVTQRAKKGISYGFQQPPRFKGMKVSDLLSCAAGKALSKADGCQYLTQVGLCSREYIDRDVDASLSGGELKRIEIATILAKKGKVMIFDEPTKGIDIGAKADIYLLMEKMAAEGIAIIMVSSELTEVMGMSDRILVMSDGKITGELNGRSVAGNEKYDRTFGKGKLCKPKSAKESVY